MSAERIAKGGTEKYVKIQPELFNGAMSKILLGETNIEKFLLKSTLDALENHS